VCSGDESHTLANVAYLLACLCRGKQSGGLALRLYLPALAEAGAKPVEPAGELF
jgi:hypothetical protein